jgi:tRNA threonylcarbamoyladenosine modification (KEOPS) complex  Pcc1 subunit
MIRTSFVFKFNSTEEARVISESINPEIKKNIPNTIINVSIFEKTLFMDIKAKNINSIRAACNSYLRWINTAFAVIKTI